MFDKRARCMCCSTEYSIVFATWTETFICFNCQRDIEEMIEAKPKTCGLVVLDGGVQESEGVRMIRARLRKKGSKACNYNRSQAQLRVAK